MKDNSLENEMTAEEILDRFLNGFNWPHWSKDNAKKAMEEYATLKTSPILEQLKREIEKTNHFVELFDEANKQAKFWEETADFNSKMLEKNLKNRLQENDETSQLKEQLEKLQEEKTELEDTVISQQTTIEEQDESSDLQWDAIQRGIKMWQEKTRKKLEWPDKAHLIVWLLEQLEEKDREIERLKGVVEKISKLNDNQGEQLLEKVGLVPANKSAAGWISVEECPNQGRVLTYSPEYEHDPVMTYRILDAQFVRIAKDVTHIKPLSPPSLQENTKF